MKKSISLLFVAAVFAQTINLNGTWESAMGYTFKAEQSGDSVIFTVKSGRDSNLIGIAGITGTITGTSFVGQVYEAADDCPNLNTYIPATGTIFENTIELFYTAPKYYPSECVYSGNYEDVRSVITRVPEDVTATVKFIEKPLDELIPATDADRFASALVDKVPSAQDMNAEENARRIKDEMWAFLPEYDPSEASPPKRAPEITGTTPYLFDDPRNVNPKKYYSFTADDKNHLVEYQGGNRLTLEFPDGTTFEPGPRDFVRVPLGTKIKTESVYRGKNEFEEYGSTSLWVSNVAGGSFVALSGGSEVVLTRSEDDRQSRVKLARGKIRVDYLGYETELPPEIQFEERKWPKLSWDETDFAVSYDPETGNIIAEIYDGTIRMQVREEEAYTMSSSYGSEIKRIEVDADGQVKGKIALPGTAWKEEQERSGRWRWLVGVTLVGLVVSAGVGVLWYKKKFGLWPFKSWWTKLRDKIRR